VVVSSDIEAPRRRLLLILTVRIPAPRHLGGLGVCLLGVRILGDFCFTVNNLEVGINLPRGRPLERRLSIEVHQDDQLRRFAALVVVVDLHRPRQAGHQVCLRRSCGFGFTLPRDDDEFAQVKGLVEVTSVSDVESVDDGLILGTLHRSASNEELAQVLLGDGGDNALELHDMCNINMIRFREVPEVDGIRDEDVLEVHQRVEVILQGDQAYHEGCLRERVIRINVSAVTTTVTQKLAGYMRLEPLLTT